jgi:hypothetical protein
MFDRNKNGAVLDFCIRCRYLSYVEMEKDHSMTMFPKLYSFLYVYRSYSLQNGALFNRGDEKMQKVWKDVAHFIDDIVAFSFVLKLILFRSLRNKLSNVFSFLYFSLFFCLYQLKIKLFKNLIVLMNFLLFQ